MAVVESRAFAAFFRGDEEEAKDAAEVGVARAARLRRLVAEARAAGCRQERDGIRKTLKAREAEVAEQMGAHEV